MRNKRFVIAIAGAISFGLISAFSVSRYLISAQTPGHDLNQVVVTKVDVPVGTKLIPEQLSVAQMPTGSTPEGTFASLDKLVGRVVLNSIAAREVVTENKLAPEGSTGGLSAVIPDGYRAMTVRVDEVVGVSGFITPGTLVDIVVVIAPPENSKSKDTISKIVLQNIKVLASGQSIDRPKDDREASAVRSVTLQVTPEQAEKLALATSEGRLQLVMRNSVDQGDKQTPGANKRSLLSGEYAAPVPDPGTNDQPKPAVRRAPRRAPQVIKSVSQPKTQPRPEIEVFVGTKRTTVEFP
ncbi:MAG TPA: Flp pilus assembly protein CpaB [Pyrinomonadaceae bacterium]|nr:Flp pilus assembly protein CpaB [Pyrinomonadaceae bacterium]